MTQVSPTSTQQYFPSRFLLMPYHKEQNCGALGSIDHVSLLLLRRRN